MVGKARLERSPLAELTPREREVLAEIAQGKSNAAIADSLVLTKRAVEKHINSIFLKLGLAYADDVSKRVKAALLFLSETDAPSAPVDRLARPPGAHRRAPLPGAAPLSPAMRHGHDTGSPSRWSSSRACSRSSRCSRSG